MKMVLIYRKRENIFQNFTEKLYRVQKQAVQLRDR